MHRTLRHRQVETDGLIVHTVEIGSPMAPPIVFLHGWPESWDAFEPVMMALGAEAHAVAMDLPGVGGSEIPPPAHDKRTLAHCVHEVIAALGLRDAALVGHDVGGMIAYAYLREFPDSLSHAVIMDTAIPGVDPWDEATCRPESWQFGFHGLHGLPERLVSGRQAIYFGHFFEALAARPRALDEATRIRHVDAYIRPLALHTGFEWFRALPQDADANRRDAGRAVHTPVLYLRGDHDPGCDLERYVQGLRAAGVHDVHGELVHDCGHWAPEERPDAVVAALREFLRIAA